MNKQNSIGDRLKEWINSKELSASDFAKQLQIQRSALSHIFSGRNKPSVDVLLKIKDAYPDISLDWLITGEIVDNNKVEKPETKESDAASITSSVTDVNSLSVGTENQDININKQIEIQSQINDPTLVRIIELYSDGTFKHYNS